MWRFPELLLFSALIACLVEHLLMVFCARHYLLQGVTLYRHTLLASNVSLHFPTLEILKDELEKRHLTLIIRDLGGGLYGIHGRHGYLLFPVCDLLHTSLRFQPDTTTVTLIGRCYWSHLILIFLGLAVALQFQNPVLLIALCVVYLVRYFFHRRMYSIIEEAAVRAWSAHT